MFSSFVTCCIIASERASGIVSRVMHVLRVPVFCLHPCFWMHVLRYPCFVRSFQLEKDRFGAEAEDRPQEEEEEEEEDKSSSKSSSSSTISASVSASVSGSVRAPTPGKKAARSTALEKEKEKHKEKEKDKEKEKEKEPKAEGEAAGQQKQELGAAVQDVVEVEGAKGKEGKAKEGKTKSKEKGKEKGKEKAAGVGNVGFKIERAGPQRSVPAKTTRFEHYKESTQFMNGIAGVIHVPCVVFCVPPTMLQEAFAALCA